MTENKIDKNVLILQKAVEELNLRFPVKEISEKTNYDKGNISNFLKGKKPVSDEFLDNFFTTFKLERMKYENLVRNNSNEVQNSVVLNPISTVNVPYFDIDFAGGWRSEELFTTVRPTSFISAQEFIRAEFACNLIGHSISKRIHSGSVIGLREVFDWQTYFPTNEIYAIVLKNQLRTVKIVKRSKDNPNILLLLPDPKPEYNTTGYDMEEIPIGFVERFYQVVAWACFEQLAM